MVPGHLGFSNCLADLILSFLFQLPYSRGGASHGISSTLSACLSLIIGCQSLFITELRHLDLGLAGSGLGKNFL